MNKPLMHRQLWLERYHQYKGDPAHDWFLKEIRHVMEIVIPAITVFNGDMVNYSIDPVSEKLVAKIISERDMYFGTMYDDILNTPCPPEQIADFISTELSPLVKQYIDQITWTKEKMLMTLGIPNILQQRYLGICHVNKKKSRLPRKLKKKLKKQNLL